MSDFITFLNSHVSIRKFTEQQISPEDEQTIITTAQRSPTSSNLQAYSIIGIRKKSTKEKLAELCGEQQHVADSSLFLIFCADLYRLKTLNEKRNYEFHGEYTEMFIIATVDAALAACRALTAAQALGLGGVMVGGIRNHPEEVGKTLDFPELLYPVMGMSLGYPDKQLPVKPRIEMDAIYHKERYSAAELKEQVARYDTVINSVGYLRGREVEKEKYPEFSGLYSWSEHTARRMAKISRPHMKSYLQSQGFIKK